MKIKLMDSSHKLDVKEMMRVFYNSSAVYTNGSDEIFENDIENCIKSSPYLEGYVFEGENGLCGYGMLAKSFSTEFGRKCIWIEDIYVKDEFRGQGIGKEFISFVKEKYRGCALRLEVEDYNERAISLYRKMGFDTLPYMEMIELL